MPSSEFIVNGVYQHDKSLEEYVLVSKNIRFQYDGIWHSAILYKKSYSDKDEYFCRTKKDFMNKFTKVGKVK